MPVVQFKMDLTICVFVEFLLEILINRDISNKPEVKKKVLTIDAANEKLTMELLYRYEWLSMRLNASHDFIGLIDAYNNKRRDLLNA